MGTIYSNLSDHHTLDTSIESRIEEYKTPLIDTETPVVEPTGMTGMTGSTGSTGSKNLTEIEYTSDIYILIQDDQILCYDVSRNKLQEYMDELINETCTQLILCNSMIIKTERREENGVDECVIFKKDCNRILSLTTIYTCFKIEKVRWLNNYNKK